MQTIYLDISNKGVIPTIYAKQGDVGRKFQVVLTDSGLPYIPVGGSAFSVWYSGTSGDGNYTDIGDKSAFSVSGNKVTVEMISQMLSNDGEGILSLVLNDPDGNQISTWNIHYICEYVPGAGSQEAKAYYTAFSQAVENLPYPDASLSVSGKAADAAATGKALAGKAPALESENYPGCYYRMVGGVQEWLNPPMVMNTSYRTTERWEGKPVYVALVDLGNMPDGQTYKDVNFPVSGGEPSPFFVTGLNSAGCTLPAHYADGNSQYISAERNDLHDGVRIRLKNGVAVWTAVALVKYILI